MKQKILISLIVGIVVFFLLQKITLIEGMNGTDTTKTTADTTAKTTADTIKTSPLTLPSTSTTSSGPPIPKPPLSSLKMVASTGAAVNSSTDIKTSDKIAIPNDVTIGASKVMSGAISGVSSGASGASGSSGSSKTITGTSKVMNESSGASKAISGVSGSSGASKTITGSIKATDDDVETRNIMMNKTQNANATSKSFGGAPLNLKSNNFLENNGYFDSRGTGDGSGFYHWNIPNDFYMIPPPVDVIQPLYIIQQYEGEEQQPQKENISLTQVAPLVTEPTVGVTAPALSPTVSPGEMRVNLGPILIALGLVTFMVFLFSR